ncbi:hypothetical protein HJFPF1_01008 [Paramyrothecium foliicola]|nr:hypothetical protein HJFPF1_01008 [Paramyrothecium foliicola]
MEASQPSPGLPVRSPKDGSVPTAQPRVNGGVAQPQTSTQPSRASSGLSSRPGSSISPSLPYQPSFDRNGHGGSHGESQRQHAGSEGPIAQPAGQAASPASGAGAAIGCSDSPDYLELTRLMKHANPQTLRQAIRDHWGLCLMGSEYHTAFILNAVLHQAAPMTLSRAVQDFGQKMVKSSKQQLLQHFTAGDLDETADLILSKCGSKFLDQALAQRFETISARDLVNALARAERLGYDVEDIVEEKHDSKPEHVYPLGHPPFQPHVGGPSPFRGTASPVPVPVPASLSAPASTPAAAPASVMRVPPPQAPPQTTAQPHEAAWSARNIPLDASIHGIEFCDQCGRPCSGKSALHHHKLKDACQNATTDVSRFDKDICLHCGVLFGSPGGLNYHKKQNVCGVYTAQRLQDVKDILTRSSGVPSPAISAPAVKKFVTSISTPGRPTTPVRPHATTTPPSSDPYASLSPGQRQRFDQEMKEVEEYYGGLMRDVVQNLPLDQQEQELAKIKNRFNTKQSMTRKKYGIRLRGRRSRAQMEEADRHLGVPTPSSQSSNQKRSRHETGPPHHPPVAQAPRPIPRVPLSEMGGLSNSSATAEHVDPTTMLTPSKPRYIPPGQSSQATANGIHAESSKGTTAADPMEIDDDNDSGSDDEDIPAKSLAGADHASAAQV